MRLVRRLVVVIVLAAAAYSAWWWWLAGEAERLVAEWVLEQQANGLMVSHGEIAISGFPLEVQATIPAPSISAANGSSFWAWQGEHLLIAFAPWDLWTYRFQTPGRNLLAISTGGLTEKIAVQSQSGEGTLVIGAAPALWQVTVVAEAAAISDDAGNGTVIANLDLGVQAVDGAAVDDAYPVHLLRLRLDGVDLPETADGPFGRRLERVAAEAELRGPLVQGDVATVLSAWRALGGRLDLRGVSLLWGPIGLEAAGTLTIDDQSRPAGAITASMHGHDAVLTALRDAGALGSDLASAIRIGLGLLSQTDAEGRETVTVPIDLVDGELGIAGIPVAPLPTLPLPPAGS